MSINTTWEIQWWEYYGGATVGGVPVASTSFRVQIERGMAVIEGYVPLDRIDLIDTLRMEVIVANEQKAPAHAIHDRLKLLGLEFGLWYKIPKR